MYNKFDDEKLSYKFGGMSGGPIYSVLSESTYSLTGIVFEGIGFGDTDSNDTPNQEMWVRGIPFTKEILEQAKVEVPVVKRKRGRKSTKDKIDEAKKNTKI